MKGGKETILVVDDDQNIQKLGEEILTRVGYDVMVARDGESALEIYRSQQKQIDLTILDLIMPGMGGVRCLQKLVEINPDAKILIASGHTVDGDKKESIGKWARGFVGKPYDVGKILHAVREVLDGQ